MNEDDEKPIDLNKKAPFASEVAKTDNMRPNANVWRGYAFTPGEFEDYIACFCSKKEILTALSLNEVMADRFCKEAYGMPFDEAYDKLLAQATMLGNKMLIQLSMKGNGTAIAAVTKYLMKKEQSEGNDALKINIVMTNVGDGKDEK